MPYRVVWQFQHLRDEDTWHDMVGDSGKLIEENWQLFCEGRPGENIIVVPNLDPDGPHTYIQINYRLMMQHSHTNQVDRRIRRVLVDE